MADASDVLRRRLAQEKDSHTGIFGCSRRGGAARTYNRSRETKVLATVPFRWTVEEACRPSVHDGCASADEGYARAPRPKQPCARATSARAQVEKSLPPHVAARCARSSSRSRGGQPLRRAMDESIHTTPSCGTLSTTPSQRDIQLLAEREGVERYGAETLQALSSRRVETFRRRVAAAPRLRRGDSVEIRAGAEISARGDERSRSPTA